MRRSIIGGRCIPRSRGTISSKLLHGSRAGSRGSASANKIDLPQSDPQRVGKEIEEIIGIDAKNAVQVSAKNGVGIESLLRNRTFIPCPEDRRDASMRALIIDSWFDNYLGVVSLVRVVQGEIRIKEKILLKSSGKIHRLIPSVYLPLGEKKKMY